MLRVTGLCVGNSPETDEFPAQRANNAENVSIWWRHHEIKAKDILFIAHINQTLIDAVSFLRYSPIFGRKSRKLGAFHYRHAILPVKELSL